MDAVATEWYRLRMKWGFSLAISVLDSAFSDQVSHLENWIAIGSSKPGQCHVEPTFDEGFVYSKDVTLVLRELGTGPLQEIIC